MQEFSKLQTGQQYLIDARQSRGSVRETSFLPPGWSLQPHYAYFSA